MLILIGSIIIITHSHLIYIYIGLELQTFSTLILIAKNKFSIKSIEASIKYFILGAISSGIYLLGVYFLYYYNSSLDLTINKLSIDNPVIIAAFSLIMITFLFKLSIAPFHFWIMDIYEGSTWKIISIVSTIPKISAFSILVEILTNTESIILCALLSIITGTLGAINQNKLKRLIAYSTVSNLGIILTGLVISNNIGIEISLFYLVVYTLISLSLFILIINLTNWKNDFIIELGGFQLSNKSILLTWLVVILSISGFPPLAGFINKWFIIWQLLSFDYFFFSIVIILFSVLSFVYYLRIIKILFFEENDIILNWNKILLPRPTNNYSYINNTFLGYLIFFSIMLIINPNPLIITLNYIFFI